MCHFMDKDILSLEMLSPFSKVTQKSAAEPNSEFNLSDSRSTSSFYLYYVDWSSESKIGMYILTVWFDQKGNNGTEYWKSKPSPQIWTLGN